MRVQFQREDRQPVWQTSLDAVPPVGVFVSFPTGAGGRVCEHVWRLAEDQRDGLEDVIVRLTDYASARERRRVGWWAR